MANSQRAAFYEKYAPLAMEQQQKYGIPASITLAQMAIESGGGTSRLAVNGNNYFGIKCTKDWLAAGKPYSLHNDDKPNEKFCNYASVEESIEHHSRFLMGKRYARCRQCGPVDYRGWATGLQSAGYATDGRYASTLVKEIEAYNLQRYDQQAGQSNQSAPSLTPEQRKNAERGSELSTAAGSNDPKDLLSYMMSQRSQDGAEQSGDLFSSLISTLFMAAIGMAMQLDNFGSDDTRSAEVSQPRVESEQERSSTLLRRERESVDASKAREMASMNFSAEYPEAPSQSQGQRLA